MVINTNSFALLSRTLIVGLKSGIGLIEIGNLFLQLLYPILQFKQVLTLGSSTHSNFPMQL